MALDVAIPPPAAPPRHREGSAAIALDALLREHGVDVDEPEERTAITTTAPRAPDEVGEEPEEPTAITTAPPQRPATSVQGSGAIALDELMRQSGVSLPSTATPVMSRPGSGAIALDELMRQSGVERPAPPAPAEPDPFEAAATIVGALPDNAGPSAWDEAAPTEVLTLPPRNEK